MRPKVLVSAPYLQPVLNRFRPLFDSRDIRLLVPPVSERLSEAELLPLMSDVDGVICGDDRFTARVFAAAPRLKVISKWGTGIDSIDREAAAAHGVAVRNTPGAFNDPVADQVMGYILSFARRIPWTTEHMRAGHWEKPSVVSLSGKTLGIIGVGNTGKAVARRAHAFGMKLLGNDLVPMPADFLLHTPIRMVDKSTLLRQSDFVSLNCDLNPTSFHLMGSREFNLMRPTSVLVNCARGSLLVETALIQSLRSETIAGAALDVFEEEPLPQDSPLRSLNNVLLSPHNANGSPEHWERIHRTTIANLFEEFDKIKIVSVPEDACVPLS